MILLLAAVLLHGVAPDTTRMPGTVAGAPMHAERVTTPIVVDGKLDEPVWSTAESTEPLHQRQPKEGMPATQRTEVRVAYDSKALYIGAHLFDTAPDSIRSALTRRDRYAPIDRFVVFLDTYHDRRSGLYFGVSAAGTQYDGTNFNDDWDDDSWDAVWTARTRRTTDGWTVEMRIPLSQLRYRPGSGQTWGINVLREIARNNERDFLVFTPSTGSGFISRFPELVGLDGLGHAPNLAIIPYVTGKLEFPSTPSTDPLNSGAHFTPGIGTDAIMAVGANLTLNATINPDFGQVEVDPAVVNLSDAEVFFQEKRPFFVQGSSIFDFGVGGANNYWGFDWGGVNLFYSRRLGRSPQGATPGSALYVDAPTGTHIDGALKLSGKIGAWNVGTLVATTRREFASYIDSTNARGRVEIEPRSYDVVTRIQREFNGGRQGLGLINTIAIRDFADPALRDQVNSSAIALGFDGWTFLGAKKAWVLTGWAAGSSVHGTAARITALQENSVHYFQRPDVSHVHLDTTATSLTGWTSRVTLNHQQGNVTFNAAVGAIAPGFEDNDLGFQTRTDRINGHVVMGYRWNRPTRWYQLINTWVAGVRNYDFGGNLVSNRVQSNGFLQFKNFSDIYVYGGNSFASLDQFATRGGPLMRRPPRSFAGVGFDSDQRKPLAWSVNVNGARGTEGSGKENDVSFAVTWRPRPQLAVSFGPEYDALHNGSQYLGTFADPYATATYGARYVFGDLDQRTLSANIRVNWIFSPKLSLEVFAQPLVSSGKYQTVRELAAPRTYQFRDYQGPSGATYDRVAGIADPDGAGPAPAFALANPDFTFASLRGNAVFRWEYRPGSTIFLVWTQNRSLTDVNGDFQPGHAFGNLFSQKADNIFLVKASYWWSR